MRWKAWLGALACAATMVAPVAAATVDFEDLNPTLFAGDSIVSGGFRFSSDGFGLSGIGAATNFPLGQAPTKASGQFLFMLDSDGMYMNDPTGAAFDLRAFDLAFIAPSPLPQAGLSVGELYVLGFLADGTGFVQDVFVLPASDAQGRFPFERMHTRNLAGQALSEVAFFACIYTQQGCDFNARALPPQFALDNISVPEPAPLALVLAAIGLWSARACRRRA